MSRPRSLGDLQLAIMRVLWASGEANVADVHRTLMEERGLAPTTIATMLRKMERRGLVKHRSEGRQFIYRATIEESAVHRSMVGELVDRLFGGDSAALVNHLITEGEIHLDELDQLRRRIARHRSTEDAP
jgi:predicted transcriptional regulator